MKIIEHHHQGKKESQEDALGHNNQAYIICDGVGGHVYGEFASNFIKNYLLDGLSEKSIESPEDLNSRIVLAQEELNRQLIDHPEWENMGTTLVGLFWIKNVWHVAHIGDSRLYWAKPDQKKIWHTWDHSFVAHLVKMGEISREAGRFHPRSNEVQRAIMAKTSNKTLDSEIHPLIGLEKGDLFLICSDGVNEAWSDYELATVLLHREMSFEDKAKTIFDQSIAQARDNNTGFLLEVETEEKESQKADLSDWISLKDLQKDFEIEKNKTSQTVKKPKWKFW